MISKKFNASSFKTKNSELLKTMVAEANGSTISTEEQKQEAFSNFAFTLHQGVFFDNRYEFKQARLKLSGKIVEAIGTDATTVSEIDVMIMDIISAQIVSSDFSLESFQDELCSKALEIAKGDQVLFAPCELYRFEDVEPRLDSKYVSVVPTSELKNVVASDFVSLTSKKPLGFDLVDGVHTANFGENSWKVSTQTSKASAPERSRWMVEVFLSAVRIGIKPADYCHRPSLGAVEACPMVPWNRHELKIVSDGKTWSGLGISNVSAYKVDKNFSGDFHSKNFQEKLEALFDSNETSVAGRMKDGLIWLSRGRQTSDPSERLLLFFTALEALFSVQDSFSPVSDTISRYVAVILSDNPKQRESTYSEVRGLYSLRSDLVHRGRRRAHALNANNIQAICEACFAIVFSRSDLTESHKSFLCTLKLATFGESWLQSKPDLGEA